MLLEDLVLDERIYAGLKLVVVALHLLLILELVGSDERLVLLQGIGASEKARKITLKTAYKEK